MPVDTTVPHSRRALLAGGLGGLAATIAAALGRAGPAQAAAGDPLVLGSQTNNAGTADTQLLTNSAVIAFKLLQNGPGTALMGYATPASGATRGVYGRTDSSAGFGVQARNAGAAGAGAAIQAFGVNNTGIDATSDNLSRNAVQGSHSSNGAGVYGASQGGRGVYGVSAAFRGVEGVSNGGLAGVYGSSSGRGVEGGGNPGVFGVSASGDGVQGFSNGDAGHGIVGSIGTNSGTAGGVYGASAGSSSYAGYFEGHVNVTGTLSKGGGAFRIDHPLDPANKILQHSFVESPDMLNIYNGVVTTDAAGEAMVELPTWFMALNRDFRYGLTPLGRPAPDLHVKATVRAGRFKIAGATPGQDVSWQLTGIRRDAWANANRIAVELDKPSAQRGQYLHPVAHGKPDSVGVDFPMQQRLAAARAEMAPTLPTG